MKDVNDNSTTEISLKNKQSGRPGRLITKDNFTGILEDLHRPIAKGKIFLNYKDEKKIEELFSLQYTRDNKGSLYNILNEIERSTRDIQLNEKKIEKLTCYGNEELSDNILYKIYKSDITKNQSIIDSHRKHLSHELDDEIGQLQKIVNDLDTKTWNRLLAARRQKMSKKLNIKSKIDIDVSIFNAMSQEKEKHNMSWDEYMASLLCLSEIERYKVIEKETKKGSFESGYEALWLDQYTN